MPSYDGHGEVQHGQIGIGTFLPSHQHTPETVHPTVRAFHHPTPCSIADFFLDGVSFLTPRPNMGCESESFRHLTDFIRIIGFVQA